MTVSYAHGDYIVTGTGKGTVELPGPVGSIMAAMGAGNDSISIEPSVPASVHSTLEGGKGEDTLRGGEGNDVLYAGEDHEPGHARRRRWRRRALRRQHLPPAQRQGPGDE